VIIRQIPAWVTSTNAWLAAESRGGRAVLVDAPPDPKGVAVAIADLDVTLAAILLTHGHVDHVGGSGEMVRRTGAVAYVHPDDDFLTYDPVTQLQILFGVTIPGMYEAPEKVHALEHGQRLELCGIDIGVVHTPGHTPGHCCFHVATEGVLFSGDQLFAGSIGRTDLPGGSFDDLMTSMRERVLVLDDETRVLPGHGPETTIGRERRHNPFLVGLDRTGHR
jgi:hydroxyacylglutathione hydrolase